MTTFLTFATGKGGVGKTSLAIAIADIAAARGVPTLLIDTDPQGDATFTIGADSDDGRAHLAMLRGEGFEPARDVRPGLDVLPAGDELDTVTDILERAAERSGTGALAALGKLWRQHTSSYSLVVVDTPPARQSETLLDAVLMGCDHLVLPTKADLNSIRAIRTLARRYVTLRNDGHLNNLRLLGAVLFASASSSTAIRSDTRESLGELFGESLRMFDAVIRATEKASRDAGLDRLTPREYAQAAAAATGPAAKDYSRAAQGLADDYEQLYLEIAGLAGIPTAVGV